MQFPTKVRYAVRAMVEMAVNYEKGPIQLKEIARKQEISEKYLEQILFPLRTSGYVLTQRGSKGGYYLKHDPQEITMLEVIQVVGGSLDPVDCVNNPEGCSRTDTCVVRNVWSRLGDVIKKELESVTFAELARQQLSMT